MKELKGYSILYNPRKNKGTAVLQIRKKKVWIRWNSA